MESINQINDRLRAVNAALTRIVTDKIVGIEDYDELQRFHSDYRNIDGFVKAMADDANGAEVLVAGTERFLDFVKRHDDVFSSLDFEKIVEDYLAPFKKAWEEQKNVSTERWRNLQSLSNRLDYLDERAEDYAQLRSECDAAEEEYHRQHDETERLFKIWDEQSRKYAALFYFDFGYLRLLVETMNAIAKAAKGGSE